MPLTTPGGGGAGSVHFSAGTLSSNRSDITFANSNGVSFGLDTNGVLTGTVATNYQSPGAYLTTAALSGDSSRYAGVNGAITGGSLTVNTSGVSINLPAYLTTAQSPGAYLTTARASNDAVGLNTALTGNGVSATINSSGISLNVPAFLTTAMRSDAGSNFVAATASVAGTNITGTIGSNGVSLSVAAAGGAQTGISGIAGSGASTVTVGTVQFANANSVSFGLNSNTMTASVSFPAQTVDTNKAGTSTGTQSTAGAVPTVTLNTNGINLGVPAWITTARASNDAVGLNSALTGNGVSATINSSGISLNVPAFLTTAQSPGAYLTTARASNDAIGLNTALTANGLSVTANSSGISLNVPAWLTTAMQSGSSSVFAKTGFSTTTVAGAVIAGTHDTNGLNLGVPAFLTTAQSPGAYLTTARASNDAVGLNTALTGNGVSATINSSGISLNVPAFLTTAQSPGAYLTTARASNDAVGLNTALTGNGVSATINSSGISLNVPAFLTTAQSPGAYLTTAMASDAGSNFVGLNSAVTGASLTVGSSGISLNVPAAAPSPVVFQVSNSTNTLGTVLFSNTYNMVWGLNGSTITASYADPDNWFLLGNTAGTNASTIGTAPLYYSGGNNVTLSGNSNTIVFSVGNYITTADLSQNSSNYVQAWEIEGANTAGTTSSAQGTKLYISGGPNITLSGNSNTIVVSAAAPGGGAGVTGKFFSNYAFDADATSTLTVGSNTSLCQPLMVPYALTMDRVRLMASMSVGATTSAATSANATSGTLQYNTSVYFGLYTRMSGGSSNSLASVATTSGSSGYKLYYSMTASQYTISQELSYMAGGTTSQTSSGYSASTSNLQISTGVMTGFTGQRYFDVPFATSLPPGDYYLIAGTVTASTTNYSSALGLARPLYSNYAYSQINSAFQPLGQASNSSNAIFPGLGSISSPGVGMAANFDLGNLSTSASNPAWYVQMLKIG